MFLISARAFLRYFTENFELYEMTSKFCSEMSCIGSLLSTCCRRNAYVKNRTQDLDCICDCLLNKDHTVIITHNLQEEPWILIVEDYCFGVILKIL